MDQSPKSQFNHVEIPIDVVKAAWEEAPEGRSRFQGRHVAKDGEMMVITTKPTRSAYGVPGKMRFIVYAKPRHFARFREAKKGVEPYGPSGWNPDAIGTAEIEFKTPKTTNTLSLLQQHSRTKGGRVLDSDLQRLTGDWRQRALREIFYVIGRKGEDLRVPMEMLRRHPKIATDLKKMCARGAITVEQKDFYGVLYRHYTPGIQRLAKEKPRRRK